MKLRLQSNSVRLRLKRAEVDQLAKSHLVEEKIVMGSGADAAFHYILEASNAVAMPCVQLKTHGLCVQIPMETALRWASGPEIGITAALPAGDGAEVHLLIEKDFACIHGGSEEDNADTFPRALEEAGAEKTT